jgi:hypoxanthine-guanine phosphoribosyltransferase
MISTKYLQDSPTTPTSASSHIQVVAAHIAKKLIDLSSPVCDPQVLIIDDVMHTSFCVSFFQ